MINSYFKKLPVCILTLSATLSWTSDAYAYFDPGTGSMVLQLLMASVLGFIFTLKIYWEKFKNIIKNHICKKSTDDYRS